MSLSRCVSCVLLLQLQWSAIGSTQRRIGSTHDTHFSWFSLAWVWHWLAVQEVTEDWCCDGLLIGYRLGVPLGSQVTLIGLQCAISGEWSDLKSDHTFRPLPGSLFNYKKPPFIRNPPLLSTDLRFDSAKNFKWISAFPLEIIIFDWKIAQKRCTNAQNFRLRRQKPQKRGFRCIYPI